MWESHIRALIEREAKTLPSERQRIVMAVNSVMDLAAGGERWACEMLRDVLDGKPRQQVEMSGADGGEIVMRIVYGAVHIAAEEQGTVIEHDALSIGIEE